MAAIEAAPNIAAAKYCILSMNLLIVLLTLSPLSFSASCGLTFLKISSLTLEITFESIVIVDAITTTFGLRSNFISLPAFNNDPTRANAATPMTRVRVETMPPIIPPVPGLGLVDLCNGFPIS